MAVFKNEVVAAHELMFKRHRRRRAFKLVAQPANVTQVVFVRVLEILRQHHLVVVKFLSTLGVSFLPFLRRFRTKRQEIFEGIQNFEQPRIPGFVLLVLHQFHEILQAFFTRDFLQFFIFFAHILSSLVCSRAAAFFRLKLPFLDAFHREAHRDILFVVRRLANENRIHRTFAMVQNILAVKCTE